MGIKKNYYPNFGDKDLYRTKRTFEISSAYEKHEETHNQTERIPVMKKGSKQKRPLQQKFTFNVKTKCTFWGLDFDG